MIIKSSKTLFLIAILGLVVTTSSHAQQTNDLLDSLIQTTLQQTSIPAMAVAVVRKDTIHYGIGGVNKNKDGTPVQLSHKFHLGSNTKAVTSFMAMKLVEQGKISLSDKFFDRWPNLKAGANKAYHDLTLGELLSHQARIPAFTDGADFASLPPLGKKMAQRKKKFAKVVLAQAPVEKGTYSNAGFVLAGLLLEQAAGKSYEALLEETFQTLHLKYVIGAPNKESDANPWGHWLEGDVLTAHSPQHDYQLEDFMLPAGDLSMNIVDYAAFIQWHLKGLLGTDNYLKASTYQLLHFGLDEYSYGWANQKTGKMPVSFHDGSLGTFYAHTIMLPEADFAFIVLINSAEEAHVTAIYKLREALFKLRARF